MLIKRTALLMIIVFLMSLSTAVLAAEPGSGIIEGDIVNRTEGGSSVADQDIALKTYSNGAEMGSAATKTDAKGRFVFDSLSTESGYSYQVTLTYQEAEYYSEQLYFDEGETTKSVEVIVYDATASDEAIKLTMAHTIIHVEQGTLHVEEYFLFVNETDRTYIGSKEVNVDGTKETLRFFLPEEATELQPGYGLMDCCIYDSESGFIDTMPVLPGNKEVLYSYRVDYKSGAYTFSRNVNYPTAGYALLIDGEGIGVDSNQLVAEEPMDIEGMRFNYFSGSDITSGEVIVAHLSGLPEANNPGGIIWIALVLAVLLGGFGFIYLMRKKRLQPASTEDSLDQRRQKLLVELAQLDDNFGDGKIPETTYRNLRAARKAELVELMQRSKKEGGNR